MRQAKRAGLIEHVLYATTWDRLNSVPTRAAHTPTLNSRTKLLWLNAQTCDTVGLLSPALSAHGYPGSRLTVVVNP